MARRSSPADAPGRSGCDYPRLRLVSQRPVLDVGATPDSATVVLNEAPRDHAPFADMHSSTLVARRDRASDGKGDHTRGSLIVEDLAITHGSPDHGYPPELIAVDLASHDRGVVAVQGAHRGDIVSDDATLDQTPVADMDRGGIRETIASFVVVVKDAIAHDAAVPGGQRGAGGQNSVKPLIAPVLPKHAVADHTISGVYTPPPYLLAGSPRPPPRTKPC